MDVSFNPLESNPDTCFAFENGDPLPIEAIKAVSTRHVVERGTFNIDVDQNHADWMKASRAVDVLKEAEVPIYRLDDGARIVVPYGLGVAIFGRDQEAWQGSPLPEGEFQGTLWGDGDDGSLPNQVGVVGAALTRLNETGCATVESPVGSGKTVMVTNLVLRLGVKTLFVCKTTNLLEQARDQGFAVFAPHLVVGQLRGTKYSTVENCDVVLTTPRTLSQRHDEAWMQRFGLLVFDEAHTAATTEMGLAASQLRCRYRLGVSATLRRNDHKFLIIPSILGDVAARLKRVWQGIRYVKHTVRYTHLPRGELIIGKKHRWDPVQRKRVEQADYEGFLQQIMASEPRNQAIASLVERDLQGRGKIFLFADRVAHLETIKNALDKIGITDAAVLYQETNKGEKLTLTLGHRVVLTTYGSGVEGINDKAVDTIYFASPFSRSATLRLEQAIGRCRPGQGKPKPLVRDFVDACGLGYAMSNARDRAARSLNPEVHREPIDIKV